MATGRWETEHEGLRGPKGPRSRRPSGFSGWQLVKRYCGEIGGQACEMNLDTEYRELPTGSRSGCRDRLARRRPCQQMTQRRR